MPKYECVIPGIDGLDYDLVSVLDDAKSVNFSLKSSGGDGVNIEFKAPAMYIVTNECYGLMTLEEDRGSIHDGTLLFKVIGGSVMNFFNEQSLNMYDREGLEHYTISCMDNIVHIIACEPPVVSQFSA